MVTSLRSVRPVRSVSSIVVPILALATLLASTSAIEAQLLENLQTFGSRLSVGPEADPGDRYRHGPKSIVAGDFDLSGTSDFAVSSTDGTITIYYQTAEGKYDAPRILDTGTDTLRQIIAADLDGNGYEDLVSASHHNGRIVILPNVAGVFGGPITLKTWRFGRNLAVGDFDGDGNTDLALAGSGDRNRTEEQSTDRGLVIYAGRGGFEFEKRQSLPGLDAGGLSRPVYSLHARPSRVPGAGAADELIITHARAANLWILRSDAGGDLEIAETIPLGEEIQPDDPDDSDFLNYQNGVYYLDVAPIASELTSGIDDIVTVHRNSGAVDIRRATAGGRSFDRTVTQQLYIPGRPRAAKLVDLNGDNWNDLVVVVRNHDRVLTYKNNQGTFEPQFESPAGKSPRDLAVADFNSDGERDVAVINRTSNDVSLLMTFQNSAGFESFDQIYLVDGDVASLDVGDLNDDNHDDVVQLHRATGDMSVRLAQDDGLLSPPVFYPMGTSPTGIRLKDVNRDGIADALTANLGNRTSEWGTLGVRLGNADGTFGDLVELDPGTRGQLFGLEIADFNGDGFLDVAVGFIDCRVVFFRGTQEGTFVPTNASFMVYEPQAMCAGDLDGDGDVDLISASWAGNLVVVENRGNLFENAEEFRTEYETPDIVRTSTLACVDVDNDGDADVVLGNDTGTIVYESDGKLGFTPREEAIEGTSFPVSNLTTSDLDGDGDAELIVSCLVFSCITILTRGEDGEYGPALTVDVPAADHIRAGDLDGDGQADLVGSGEVLWTALSGKRPEVSGPSEVDGSRPSAQRVVINELLAINDSLAFPETLLRTSDFVELFNGSNNPVDISGWTLGRTSPTQEVEGVIPRAYTFPPQSIVLPGSYLLVLLDGKDEIEYPHRVDWRLPGGGAKVLLLDRAGDLMDEVTYPEQIPDVSFARFRDGISSFAYNPSPSPGRANLDNGTVEPSVSLINFGPQDLTLESSSAAIIPGQPIRLFAEASDESAVINVSVVYRTTEDPRGIPQRAILFDDGAHSDGGFQDGLFSGTIPGVAVGTGIEFYLETEDVQGNTSRAPGDAELTPGQVGEDVYRSVAPAGLSPIELSEFVASNRNGLRDESGRPADWVEVRNCSASTVSLDGIRLADTLADPSDWYSFPAGLSLAPGEQIIVFCDSDPEEGPFHTAFDLEASGEELILLHEQENGFPAIIDSVRFGTQPPDVAYAKSSCGGEWDYAEPTPGGVPQLVTSQLGDTDRNRRIEITDAVAILDFLFRGGRLICEPAGDANSDNRVDISDTLYILNFLFVGGPPIENREVTCGAGQ